MSGQSLVWYGLRWPREVTALQLTDMCSLLAGSGAEPFILESVGKTGSVAHRVAVPKGYAGTIVQQLRAGLPGLALDVLSERPRPAIDRAIAVRLSTRHRSIRTEESARVNRALLTALAHVGGDEQLVVQWYLGSRLMPKAVPQRLESTALQSWSQALLTAPLQGVRQVDGEMRSAVRTKRSEAGWKVAGRVGVQADSRSRQRQLIRQVLGALAVSEAPGVGYWVHSIRKLQVIEARVPWRKPLRLNASELATVSSWPVGMTRDLPVNAVGSRLVAPSAMVHSRGRVIGQATFPGKERTLSLMPTDALRHLHAIGPSGSGKSTLLLNLITQDINAGRGVVVIEPKQDLIAQILERIPAERMDDVVLLDPTDATRPVGLNPLASQGRPPELVADHLLAIFRALFEQWGPRVQEVLHAALLTLARQPNATLISLSLLLTNASFRRAAVSRLDDPVGLEPFWAAYEAWGEQERAAAIAPAMRRLRPFLMRPDVQGMIGQAQPRFDIREVFTKRKIVLVNLATGLLGAETASLLGSLVVAQLWQATLGRAAIAPERRHPVFVYCDEFQEYLKLPTDFTDALAQARSYGVGFVLAHQYLRQLDSGMQAAVLANVQSRIAFRLPHRDAVTLAAGSGLEPEDFESLGAYQCYAQLVAGGTVQPWCSLRTTPAVEPMSDSKTVKAASRQRYGVDRAEVEAVIRKLANVAPPQADDDDLKPRRRNPGAAS